MPNKNFCQINNIIHSFAKCSTCLHFIKTLKTQMCDSKGYDVVDTIRFYGDGHCIVAQDDNYNQTGFLAHKQLFYGKGNFSKVLLEGKTLSVHVSQSGCVTQRFFYFVQHDKFTFTVSTTDAVQVDFCLFPSVVSQVYLNCFKKSVLTVNTRRDHSGSLFILAVDQSHVHVKAQFRVSFLTVRDSAVVCSLTQPVKVDRIFPEYKDDSGKIRYCLTKHWSKFVTRF